MTGIIGWAITALVAVLLLACIAAIISMRALPLGERPRTPTYDRFGNLITEMQNPDYHENPGEDSLEDPATPSTAQ